MPINRTAPQATQVVQTSGQMVYRLPTTKRTASQVTKTPAAEILTVPIASLQKDLLKTLVTTLLVVGILIAIKLSQALS